MADEGNVEQVEKFIKEFCDVTGVEHQRARLYLEASGWELDLAIANFYEDSDDNLQQVTPSPLVMDEPTPPPAYAPPTPPPAYAPPNPAPPIPTSAPANRFATLASILKEENSDDEGQAFYAGGSERSGQQVLGPGKKKKEKSDLVSEMFRAAKEHGASVLEPNDLSTSKKSHSVFRGTGYKLGSDENSSVAVPNSSNVSQPERSVEMCLKMWKNGFSIDDGPLREYADPRNVLFLQSIKKGEIPQELYQQAKGEVNLNMEDHQHQEYQSSAGKSNTFVGEGHRLGNPAPGVTTPVSSSASSIDGASDEAKALKLLDVDDKQPTTNIQIRLADGSRLIARLNLTHTVGDIRRYLVTARPHFETAVFSLLTTFPNRELTDDNLSIKEADLLNAVIVQKMN